MDRQDYFTWFSGHTGSNWNNDSAVHGQVEYAMSQGAVGLTTNPPLSYEALVTDTDLYAAGLAQLNRAQPDDDFAMDAMCLVVRHFSEYLMPLHEKRGTYYGCVRAQVAPNLRADGEKMLKAGKRLSAIGKNVMVKIPGTKTGMKTLEDLAALGIPTNPTVVTTVPQAIAAAEAFERGRERAAGMGMAPAWSTCAIVMGRTQDYFSSLNEQRGLGLSGLELAWAALAIVKRSYKIFDQRKYHSLIMPAAFRAPLQVEQLAGGVFHATIHPKIQKAVQEADLNGILKRELLVDCPVDEGALNRVAKAIPEFAQAYEPDGLTPDEFDTYGAVTMTLDGFEAGWQQLVSLK